MIIGKKKSKIEVAPDPRIPLDTEEKDKAALLNPSLLLAEALSQGLETGYAELEEDHITKAPNIVEWMISTRFLSIRPFPKQIEDALNIFGEWCWFCSNVPYIRDIPVDAKLGDILDNLQLMRFGRCPKCKRQIIEQRHEWLLDPENRLIAPAFKEAIPNDVALLEGQRCVSGETCVMVKDKGPVPIKEIEVGTLIRTPDGWQAVEQTYVFENRPSLTLVFENGKSLCCGYNHKVGVLEDGQIGFKEVERLFIGHPVAHFDDQVGKSSFIMKPILLVRKNGPTTLYDLTVPGHVYWTDGVYSHNSGKSVKTTIYSTYILHRYLTLPNPSSWFGLLKNVGGLEATYVSITARQAQRNLWKPFSDLIKNSPWFQEYHEWLDLEGKRRGEELYKNLDTFLVYQHKRLGFSFAPADQRSLRGATRFISALDELGWLLSSTSTRGGAVESKIKIDGLGIVRALDRSLSTIRNAAAKRRSRYQNTPDAYQMTLSSPSSATDPMMQRVRKADKSPRMYYIRRASWNSNPNITEAQLREQEEGNMTEAEFLCDFACIPPYSDKPWWEDYETLLSLCHHEKPFWHLEHKLVADKTGLKTRWLFGELSDMTGDKQVPRALALDTGEKNCSFSWALMHYEKQPDQVVTDDLGEIAPDTGQRIHMGLMWERIIVPIVEKFHLVHVVWDRWQSSRYVADLRTKYMLRAEQFTATQKDGRRMKSDMLNHRLLFPKPEIPIKELPIGQNAQLARYPKSHLLLQYMTVRDYQGLPIKPQTGNDDTLRAVLLGHALIRDNLDLYSTNARMLGSRCVGIGVGGRRQIGGGNSVAFGAGGMAIGVGTRRR